MPSDETQLLSQLTTRRAFMAKAGVLSLAIPGVGGALVACADKPGSEGDDDAQRGERRDSDDIHRENPNSKLDTALPRGARESGTSGAPAAAFQRYNPELPPLAAGGRVQLHWRARETNIRISESTTVAAWTFEDELPGPIVHCRVGDTVEFTLTNDVDVPHSMDFHSAQIDPKIAFRSVTRGQSVTYTFRPRFAGAFMYHCGSSPVLMHIGAGMHGAMIVQPREGLPAAREFVLVQQEFYLKEEAGGVRAFDYQKMLVGLPDFVTFNGRPNQYVDAPLRAKVGERVRFWVVNAGPTHPCNFHVVGEQFDTMYLGAPPGTPIRGVQTFAVAPGGGMCFELLCDVAGEFPFVNHGFGHGQKGGIGFLVVET